CQTTKIMIVGIEVLGRLAPGTLDFGLLQLWGDCANHARRQLVLQVEDVLQCAVEAVRPQVRSRSSVNELATDADAAACFSNTAFKYVVHTQFAPDLLNVRGPAFVGEGRIAGDDEEPAHSRQGSNDFLDHTVREVLLLAVTTQ